MAVTINRTVRSYYDGENFHNEVEYKGLSTDSKPTDCEANSLFLELDTGDLYYFTGVTWSKVGA